jgi:hypothetical protein
MRGWHFFLVCLYTFIAYVAWSIAFPENFPLVMPGNRMAPESPAPGWLSSGPQTSVATQPTAFPVWQNVPVMSPLPIRERSSGADPAFVQKLRDLVDRMNRFKFMDVSHPNYHLYVLLPRQGEVGWGKKARDLFCAIGMTLSVVPYLPPDGEDHYLWRPEVDQFIERCHLELDKQNISR